MVQLYITLLYYTFMKTLVLKIVTMVCLLMSVFLIKNGDGLFLPWYMDIALFSSAFFLLGNILKSICGYSEWLPDFRCKKIVAIITLVAYFCFAYFLQNKYDMEFHYAYNYYENPLLFILLSVLGIVCICVFFQAIHIKLFSLFGKNSLAFFAFNGKAKALSLLILPNALHLENHIMALLLCLIESAILLFISSLINKYCPWLIGKYKKK